jgi:hypothetical protein
MTQASAFARVVKRGAWLAAIAAMAGASLVSAQPSQPVQTAPPTDQSASPPPAPGAPTPPAAPEEAPPQEAPTPAPVATPPISEKEVAPAPQAPVAEEKPAAPLRRARYDIAILEALDKVTAENLVFAAPVGKPVRYKGLIFTVRACERSTPEEPVEDSIAYLTIDSQPRAEAGRPTPPARQVFKGWMYASSPGLNALEHPVYDAWVISCRTAAPSTVASR